MNKVKCINNHYYDADRYSFCPACGKGVAGKFEKQEQAEPQAVDRRDRLNEAVSLIRRLAADKGSSQVTKTRCKNGHFFNAGKYTHCPVCGAGVSDSQSQKPPAAEPVRPSRLDPVDKTELLEEEAQPAERPTAGNASGITWRFRARTAEAGAKELEQTWQLEAVQASPQSPAAAPMADALTQTAKPEIQETDTASSLTQTAKPEIQEANTASSLTQAVAATGHGITSALPKTVAYYDLQDPEMEPPTAWLVCVKGVYQGAAFACKSGRNRIGRNQNCNINLIKDSSVTREPHAMVIYDPKQRLFFLQNGTGDGLVYHNGSLLFSHEQLNAYDQIQIGNAEFIFLPLCGQQFAWEDYIG